MDTLISLAYTRGYAQTYLLVLLSKHKTRALQPAHGGKSDDNVSLDGYVMITTLVEKRQNCVQRKSKHIKLASRLKIVTLKGLLSNVETKFSMASQVCPYKETYVLRHQLHTTNDYA